MSKAWVFKIIQSRGFLGSLLSKIHRPWIKVAVPIAKNILTPFGRKYVVLEQQLGIMKFVQALEDSNILLKGITRIIENKTKEQKRGFSGMLLGTPGASFLGKCYQKK